MITGHLEEAEAKARPAGRSLFSNRERARYWAARVAEFGVWQMAAQLIQLLTGFLLIRWMTVEAYAQYGLALGFQNMLGQLIDLGFSGSIVALVGARIGERTVVGRYVRSALSLRNGFLLIAAPISAMAFLWIARQHHWPTVTSLLLFGTIVAYLVFQGWAGCYSAPLLMHREMKRFFAPSVLLNAGKLAVCWLVQACSTLGAIIVCFVNVLSTSAMALLYRASVRAHIEPTSRSDVATRREIFRYVTPLLPGMVFYAFQGQIQVFLISFFGQTRSIAEVVALGRLGQVFTFLSAFMGVVAAPYIARLPQESLRTKYLAIAGCASLLGAGVTLIGFFAPQPFLWVLGPKYSSLHREVAVSLASSSVMFIGGALFTLNSARRWVFHWNSVINVGGVVTAQAMWISFADMSHSISVLMLSLVSSCIQATAHLLVAIYGLYYSQADLETT